MIEIIILALVGSAIAGLWDLKTTEVPGEIPILMCFGGGAYWYFQWITSGIAYPFIVSILLGLVVLGIGLLMYHKKAWGEADAWILAAIAFMVPLYTTGEVFFLDYIFNFLIVAVVYMVLYSLIIGLKNKSIFGLFAQGVKKRWFIVFPVLIVCATAAVMFPPMQFPSFLLAFMVLFWVYARVIENNVFKKQISVKDLKVGDVLLDEKWIGVTQEDIDRLRKTTENVTIKDGVRFVPVFAITLAVTLLWGNILLPLLLF